MTSYDFPIKAPDQPFGLLGRRRFTLVSKLAKGQCGRELQKNDAT